MKGVVKFILISTGSFVIVVALAIVGIGVIINSKYGGEIKEKIAEGSEFGRTTDKNGCLQEGLKRAKSIGAELKPIDDTLNKTFVNACFETSPTDAEFCRKVPPLIEVFTKSRENELYEEQSCLRLGFSETHESCKTVMTAKREFCALRQR